MDNGKRHRPRWQSAAIALGGAVAALTYNDLSALSYRAQLGLALGAAAVIAAWGIRTLPRRALLRRYAPWCFLTPAAAAAAAGVFSPEPGALILTAVAIVLTASAVVVATHLKA